MGHALKAELDYFRAWLLGGFGIAAGVAILVTVIFWLVGEEGPPSHAAAGIRAMFLVMAPLQVGFIAQTFYREERRARLLLAGPLAPRQLAALMVLLPVCFAVLGVVAGGLALGVDALVTGRLQVEAVNMAGFVGGLVFAMLMIALLIQELTAAQRQRRRRSAVAGWAALGVAVIVLGALWAAGLVLQGSWTWTSLHLGNLVVAAASAAAAVELYARRTDFTR